MPVRLIHATANRPGAIAVLQLVGESRALLRTLTGVEDWPVHRVRLVNFAGIDEGLAVRLSENVAQLMPHGGPRVVQRLTAHLLELGAAIEPDAAAIDPLHLYPEATDRFEALMMLALSRAQSSLAIDLLLDQPRRWRELHARQQRLTETDLARSKRLNRLIEPPLVVLAGQPNVGKSTLSNALAGRSISIALDMPGTTIDYTAAHIDLAGLSVIWHDTPGIRATPGIRSTGDPIENKAVELAAKLINSADFLIAMRDPDNDWPKLPHSPHLRVINKADLLPHSNDAPIPGARIPGAIAISARTGAGLAELVTTVRDLLVSPDDFRHSGPWLFDSRLTHSPL